LMDSIIGTLLEIIPKELINIIECKINDLIATHNENIIAIHEQSGFRTHLLCHICKLNQAIFFLDKELVISDFSKHGCCLYCIDQKKYLKCDGCDQTMRQSYIGIKKRYIGAKNDIDALVKTGRHGEIISGRLKNCPLCFPYIEYYNKDPCCINCCYKYDLAKCYHETIHGKCIIYLCKKDECKLKFPQ